MLCIAVAKSIKLNKICACDLANKSSYIQILYIFNLETKSQGSMFDKKNMFFCLSVMLPLTEYLNLPNISNHTNYTTEQNIHNYNIF